MTRCTVDHALSRIAHAPTHSPIAVYLCTVAGHVDARFGNTFQGHRDVLDGNENLIGLYHSGQDLVEVEKKLGRFVK